MAASCGALVGDTRITAVVPVGFVIAGEADATPGVAAIRGLQFRQLHGVIPTCRDLNRQVELTVVPGSETLSQEVVRLTRLAAGRIVARVDEPETQ